MYESVRTIMSLICSCKDAKKGTILTEKDWLNGNYSIKNGVKLSKDDLLNKKYFIEQNECT